MEKIGINLDGIKNLSAPTFDLPTSGVDIINQIPITANEIGGAFLAYAILFGLFVINYWLLSDKSPLSEFRFSDIRAINISFTISSIVGLSLISIGYIQSWRAVVFMLLAYLLSLILLITIENK